MKTLFTAIACCALCVPAVQAQSQGSPAVVVEEETTVITDIPCKTHYYVNGRDNWFLQFGAGTAVPFVEGKDAAGHRKSQFTLNYNVGFGKWFSPYLGWRLAFYGGPLHYQDGTQMRKMNYVNANADIMWDMFNSLGGVNADRVFSIIPFAGIGGTYSWNMKPAGTILARDGSYKTSTWTLPVSAGIQLRFRLCKYVDFFAEGRAGFYGDNFNNLPYGYPVDINGTITGGFTINFGGRQYRSYNPCDYAEYISTLNNQVNDLRGALATTAAALAAAEAQLPCPEVTEPAPASQPAAPMMASVRFNINSAKISSMEMVNVYNTARWMKDNPDQNVAIVGYADKDTGTPEYNMQLSKRRAQAVYDALVNKYGINPDRLSIAGEGSASQPYDVNSWNRIVIFNAAE